MCSKPAQRQPAIVLFDGVCNLCNVSVTFIIDRDPHGWFRFAALQSETGRRLLAQAAWPSLAPDSIMLIESGRVHTDSTAVLRIARRLRGWWPLLYGLIVIPAPVRDGVYRWIAANRYRWFGQSTSCRVPTPDLQQRFL